MTSIQHDSDAETVSLAGAAARLLRKRLTAACRDLRLAQEDRACAHQIVQREAMTIARAGPARNVIQLRYMDESRDARPAGGGGGFRRAPARRWG